MSFASTCGTRGSMDDPPGKEGLAHLVEHMLFDVEIPRGDKKTSISAELGRIALWWNAYTDKDHTTYQVLASPEHSTRTWRSRSIGWRSAAAG